jgi:hypothetical protein
VIVNEHQLALKSREGLFWDFPSLWQNKSLPDAQQHRQIASVLDDFGAAAFLARQLAQRGQTAVSNWMMIVALM